MKALMSLIWMKKRNWNLQGIKNIICDGNYIVIMAGKRGVRRRPKKEKQELNELGDIYRRLDDPDLPNRKFDENDSGSDHEMQIEDYIEESAFKEVLGDANNPETD
jgi:hypothetical protein